MLYMAGLFILPGCQSTPKIPTVPQVDLPRFMGDWSVIANIPTSQEKDAHNAIESYKLLPDGTIATTFTFRDGSFDGPLKKYTPRGFVVNKKTNAQWAMQFIWPLKGEFLIIYLNSDYSITVIGRSNLDYLWIMARTPSIPEEEYSKLVKFVEDIGYNVSKIQKVPHRWDPE